MPKRIGENSSQPLTVVRVMVLIGLLGFLAVVPAAFTETVPTLTTDKADYDPDEIVHITGAGFAAGDYALPVLRPDGSIVKGDGTFEPGWDTRPADEFGNLVYDYQLDGVAGLYEARAYPADWAGDWDLTPITSVTFTDAPPAANLDQCANGNYSSPDSPCIWQNGNLNVNQAHLIEGYSTPYRVVMTDLPVGTDITLELGYDIKHSDAHALDFLTHYQRLEPHDGFGHPGETVDPLAGVTGVSSTVGTYPIPVPSSVYVPATGTTQPSDRFNLIPAAERVMTLFGGTISNIAYTTQGNLSASQSETRIAVTFQVDSATAVLAWGGHIARSDDWGDGNAATGISGSPYHMRLKGWDLNSLGQQDRSLKAASVFPTGKIVIQKIAVGGDGTFNYDATGTGLPATFDITTSGGSGEVTYTEVLAVNSTCSTCGQYTVTEDLLNLPDGWEFTNLVCSEDENQNTTWSGTTASIVLDPHETVTCTYTNTRRGKIIIDKVTNPGGDPQLFDFTLAGGPSALNQNFQLADATTPHDSGAILPGSGYNAAETVPPGWDLTSATCDDASPVNNIDVSPGETVTCTFTNTKRGHIVIDKVTIPGGDPQLFDFTLAGGPSALNQSFPLADATTPHDSGAILPGSGYNAAETVPPGWDLTSATCDDGSPVNNIDVSPGETVTCTFTNTKRGEVKVIKTENLGLPTLAYSFQIREGASPTADGTVLATATTPVGVIEATPFSCVTGADPADCVNVEGIAKLPPGTYQFCEVNILPGIRSSLSTIPGYFVPNSVDSGGTADNSTICLDFNLLAGETRTFSVDNQTADGDARTPGFWKNWSDVTRGRQEDVLGATIENSPFLNEGTGTRGFWVGDLWVDNTQHAFYILNKSDLNGKKKANDAAYELATFLLTARLNINAFVPSGFGDQPARSCQALLDGIDDSQTLLEGIGFNGFDKYLDNKTAKKDGTEALRQLALAYASYLNLYANNEPGPWSCLP